MNETKRTILLVILITVAIGFIIWTRVSYGDNFIDSFWVFMVLMLDGGSTTIV